ncbi:TetR/AcrR family transcriptional regulator [Desulfocastanea catecholica]|jgi:AcrR family transcriptional regulator
MIQTNIKRKTKQDILELSGALFATFGYDRVSMRDVAAATGITPAGLYYYFSDKEQLYLEVVAHEFREKTAKLIIVLNGNGAPWVRLELFITNLTHLVATNENFLRLMQWVRLDSDEVRQQKLAEYVFKDLFVALRDLVVELDSRYDAHMLAMSVFGLVVISFEAGLLRKLMPGHRPEYDNPDMVAKHVIELLRSGLSKTNGNAF